MSGPPPKNAEQMVLLGMAGISKPAIKRHLDSVCRSDAFHDGEQAGDLLTYLVNESLEGRVPLVTDIAKVLGKPNFSSEESFVRTAMKRLRERLDKHYDAHGKPGEIRFTIPNKEYFVLTPKIVGTARAAIPTDQAGGQAASVILEPSDLEEVYAKVTVRGRIAGLDPDLRVWLVVGVSYSYYPQCRVSRSGGEWEYDVRIGRLPWGGPDEGGVFDINLVAAGVDGDATFYQYQKAGGDGFGSVLPPDVFLLDTKRVIRRDIRPENGDTR